MKETYRNNVLNRLKTARGHLDAIVRMVEDDTYCPDLMKQLSAVQGSLDRVGLGDLVAAVGKMGYGLAPAQATKTLEDASDTEAQLQRMWLRRVAVAWPLGLIVLYLSLFHMMDPWARWTALVLTVPVQFW